MKRGINTAHCHFLMIALKARRERAVDPTCLYLSQCSVREDCERLIRRVLTVIILGEESLGPFLYVV